MDLLHAHSTCVNRFHRLMTQARRRLRRNGQTVRRSSYRPSSFNPIAFTCRLTARKVGTLRLWTRNACSTIALDRGARATRQWTLRDTHRIVCREDLFALQPMGLWIQASGAFFRAASVGAYRLRTRTDE